MLLKGVAKKCYSKVLLRMVADIHDSRCIYLCEKVEFLRGYEAIQISGLMHAKNTHDGIMSHAKLIMCGV